LEGWRVGMEKELLINYFENKTQIKLNLKNDRFFTGTIIKLLEHSLVFKDRFEKELVFDLDSISYIDVVREDEDEFQRKEGGV